jgi:hypothetical protein
LIRLLRQGLASQQICTRPIRPAITGFGQEVLRLDSPQLPLLHDPAQSGGSTHDVMIAEFLMDPAVTVTATIAFKNLLNEPAHADIFMMGRSDLCRMIEAAARQSHGPANLADAAACL